MAIALMTERPFTTGYAKNAKDFKFLDTTDVKEAKKMCPWAVITVPYTKDGVSGRMAFRSVPAYTYWIQNENK